MLGVIADVHLHNHPLGAGTWRAGVNERVEVVCACLERLADMGLTHLAILGDLFDVSTPPPQVIARLMQSLKVVTASGVEVLILRGNHDMVSEEPGDNALAPLAFMPGVHVFNKPDTWEVLGMKVLMLPYPYRPTLPQFKMVRADVVMMHCGVAHPDTPDFLADAGVDHETLLEWMDSQKRAVPLLLAGDWHEHKRLAKGRIIQVGTFAPKSKSDAFDKAGVVVIVDPSSYKMRGGVSVPRTTIVEVPGPRFVSAPSKAQAVELAERLLEQGCKPFVSYPRGAETPEDRKIKVPDGAVVRADRVRDVKDVAAQAGEQLREKAAQMDPRALLKAYLKHAYKDAWKKMYRAISEVMG